MQQTRNQLVSLYKCSYSCHFILLVLFMHLPFISCSNAITLPDFLISTIGVGPSVVAKSPSTAIPAQLFTKTKPNVQIFQTFLQNLNASFS